MHTTTNAPRRPARAVALAGCAALVGAVSHLLTGGAVTPFGVLCTVPVLLAAAWPLTGKERGWLAILGVQLVGQQAAHLLLGLGAGPGGHAPTGHDPAVPHGPGLTDAALPVDLWFAGHVAAAVLVSAWLRCGERRAWSAARRAGGALVRLWRRLLRPLGGPAPASPPVTSASPGAVPTWPGRVLRHSVARRGPPLPA